MTVTFERDFPARLEHARRRGAPVDDILGAVNNLGTDRQDELELVAVGGHPGWWRLWISDWVVLCYRYQAGWRVANVDKGRAP